jgi:ribosomal-protein-alanine N-acetyltransferase
MRSMRIEIPERLSDEAVILRPLRTDDARPYAAAFRADPELGWLAGYEDDPDEDWVRKRAEEQPKWAEEGKGFELAIADPGTDGFWGCVILHGFDWKDRRCEVGFWLVPEVRQRGVGTRATSLAVSWAFENLDLLRVEMTTTPDKLVVPRLARRLGFTYEGTLRKRAVERGRRVDVLWFGVLREEWTAETAG